MKDKRLDIIISNYIKELGISANRKGYYYLRYGIKLLIKDIGLASSITKVIYPAIAKEFKTTSTRVERAIRHGIEASWEDVNHEELIEMFGYRFSERKGKPTNSEFMATVADYIRLMEEV